MLRLVFAILSSCVLSTGALSQRSGSSNAPAVFKTFGPVQALDTTPISVRHSDWRAVSQSPQISLVSSVRINGSFLYPQAVYADSERIYLCSYQGDLFVLQRDRETNFALLQTISIGAPLASVLGDRENIYVSSRNGNLYVFRKTWPLQFLRSVELSNYGISALAVVGANVYAAKGQASMAATESRLYLSELNAGDYAIEVGSMRSFGEGEFVAGKTLVFDTQAVGPIRAVSNPNSNHVNLSAWGPFIYLTNPGCCGFGVYIYAAGTLEPVQFLNRPANVFVGIQRMGVPLGIAGSEFGDVHLYSLGETGYRLEDSVDLRAATGFRGSEDIEIRAVWVDGIDNLVFAASSWGNDESRGGSLPTFFALEIRLPFKPPSCFTLPEYQRCIPRH
jgi:hypothetical protein